MIAWIGLGGNIGDVRTNMSRAIRMVDHLADTQVDAVSPLYSTPPWGDVDQPDFLNACMRIRTKLDVVNLLGELKRIERELARVATRRWGPRTIDLDILVFGTLSLETDQLQIPHPRMCDRAFVLKPLSDLDPDLVVKGKTVTSWLAENPDRQAISEVAGKGWEARKQT